MASVQSTAETCLVCCLWDSLEATPITRTEERELFLEAIAYDKHDFTGGHIAAFQARYKNRIDRYVESSLLQSYLSQRGASARQAYISVALIDSLTQAQTVIVYIDSFVLHGRVHQPHFIRILGNASQGYTIADPWTGEERSVMKAAVDQGIDLLRTHLRFSPEVITIQKDV